MICVVSRCLLFVVSVGVVCRSFVVGVVLFVACFVCNQFVACCNCFTLLMVVVAAAIVSYLKLCVGVADMLFVLVRR